MTQKRYRSRLREAVHNLAEDVHAVGRLDDAEMAEYDRLCLIREHVKPDQIKTLREQAAVSQADFAYHLNVSPGLVSQWERGLKKPSGPSLKLLDLVARKGLDAII